MSFNIFCNKKYRRLYPTLRYICILFITELDEGYPVVSQRLMLHQGAVVHLLDPILPVALFVLVLDRAKLKTGKKLKHINNSLASKQLLMPESFDSPVAGGFYIGTLAC